MRIPAQERPLAGTKTIPQSEYYPNKCRSQDICLTTANERKKLMMKQTVRVLSLILALLMCTAALVSCGGDDEETKASVGNDGAEYENELEAQDFGGREFRVLDANDQPDMHVNFAEDMNGTAVQQALYKRDMYIEERNKVNIVYTQVTNTNLAGISAFTDLADGGDRPYDLVVSTASGGRLPILACSGYFSDLKTLPTLDLSQKWWSAEMNEAMSLGGKMYFTTGDIMASVYDAPMAVYANKSLLDEYQITDNLYSTVKDDKWTLEYMSGLVANISRDVNNDGVMHASDDIFGVISEPNRMSSVGMLVGMGYENSYVANNAIFVNDDMETLESLCSKIKGMVQNVTFEVKADIINKAFKNDRAVFLVHLVEAANHKLRDMSSDFMVLPMPKGDENQENYRSYMNGWVDCFISVPTFDASKSGEAEFHGYMLEAMARASYDIVRPVAFEQVVMLQSTRDPDAIEMLEIIYNTLYLDFQGVFDFGGQGTLIAQHVFADAELASSMAGIKSKITSEAAERSAQWLNPGAVK